MIVRDSDLVFFIEDTMVLSHEFEYAIKKLCDIPKLIKILGRLIFANRAEVDWCYSPYIEMVRVELLTKAKEKMRYGR